MMTTRIYPVPVKPRSGIERWSGWPEDVEPVLLAWNRSRSHSLSFVRCNGVFKCMGCDAFCQPANNGAAVLDGDFLCDDCLIVKARA